MGHCIGTFTTEELAERKALHARGLKKCGRCKRTFPLGDFGNDSRTGDKLRNKCRSCNSEETKAWIARTIARVGAQTYYRRCNLRKYGFTPDEYDAVSARQKGRCASCGETPPPHSRSRYRLEVDHDHKNGRSRELLCHGCNVGFGGFADTPKRLRAALRYLRKHGIT